MAHVIRKISSQITRLKVSRRAQVSLRFGASSNKRNLQVFQIAKLRFFKADRKRGHEMIACCHLNRFFTTLHFKQQTASCQMPSKLRKCAQSSSRFFLVNIGSLRFLFMLGNELHRDYKRRIQVKCACTALNFARRSAKPARCCFLARPTARPLARSLACSLLQQAALTRRMSDEKRATQIEFCLAVGRSPPPPPPRSYRRVRHRRRRRRRCCCCTRRARRSLPMDGACRCIGDCRGTSGVRARAGGRLREAAAAMAAACMT